MVFTPEQKIKIDQFLNEAKSYIAVRRRFCHEFELLSRDAPSSKLIMIFVQHLDKQGYRAHCTTHTRSVQRSPCPRLASMPYASQSPHPPPPKKKKKCCRHLSKELVLSPTSTLRIMIGELKFFPYIIFTRGKQTTASRRV